MQWIVAILIIWFIWANNSKNDEVLQNYPASIVETAQETYNVPAEDLTEGQLDETQQAEVEEAANNCTGDCSGHQAGYEWAQDSEISSESDCDGNSDSFNEGCVNYVDGGSGF